MNLVQDQYNFINCLDGKSSKITAKVLNNLLLTNYDELFVDKTPMKDLKSTQIKEIAYWTRIGIIYNKSNTTKFTNIEVDAYEIDQLINTISNSLNNNLTNQYVELYLFRIEKIIKNAKTISQYHLDKLRKYKCILMNYLNNNYNDKLVTTNINENNGIVSLIMHNNDLNINGLNRSEVENYYNNNSQNSNPNPKKISKGLIKILSNSFFNSSLYKKLASNQAMEKWTIYEKFKYCIKDIEYQTHLNDKYNCIKKNKALDNNSYKPKKIYNNNLLPLLGADYITPTSVAQGIIGDCSFLASILACVHYENKTNYNILFKNIFPQNDFQEPVINPNGIYCVIFNYNGTKKFIVIDDIIPLNSKGKILLSSSLSSNEYRITIYCKALIKYYNGTTQINGANPSSDLYRILGWPTETIYLFNCSNIYKYYLWKQIFSNYKSNKCIICVGTSNLDSCIKIVDHEENISSFNNLIEYHAYSVIGVEELNEHQMIKLYNPWGSHSWKGKYDNNDSVWDTNFELVKLCAFSKKKTNEGCFWLPYSVLFKFFSHIYFAWNLDHLQQKNYTYSNNSLLKLHSSEYFLPISHYSHSLFDQQFRLKLNINYIHNNDIIVWLFVVNHTEMCNSSYINDENYCSIQLYHSEKRISYIREEYRSIYMNAECILKRILINTSSKNIIDSSNSENIIAFNDSNNMISVIVENLESLVISISYYKQIINNKFTFFVFSNCDTKLSIMEPVINNKSWIPMILSDKNSSLIYNNKYIGFDYEHMFRLKFDIDTSAYLFIETYDNGIFEAKLYSNELYCGCIIKKSLILIRSNKFNNICIIEYYFKQGYYTLSVKQKSMHAVLFRVSIIYNRNKKNVEVLKTFNHDHIFIFNKCLYCDKVKFPIIFYEIIQPYFRSHTYCCKKFNINTNKKINMLKISIDFEECPEIVELTMKILMHRCQTQFLVFSLIGILKFDNLETNQLVSRNLMFAFDSTNIPLLNFINFLCERYYMDTKYIKIINVIEDMKTDEKTVLTSTHQYSKLSLLLYDNIILSKNIDYYVFSYMQNNYLTKQNVNSKNDIYKYSIELYSDFAQFIEIKTIK